MTDELKEKVEILEKAVESLTQKVNEVVKCLEDNEIYSKNSVDYLYLDEDNEEEEEEEEKGEKGKQ